MKKITTLILVLSLAAAQENVNAQWVQQSAIPTERSMYSAYFLTPSHGFVEGVDDYGLLGPPQRSSP